MIERRKEPRFRLSLPVKVSGLDESGEPFAIEVMATSLSRSGALLTGLEVDLRCGDMGVLGIQGMHGLLPDRLVPEPGTEVGRRSGGTQTRSSALPMGVRVAVRTGAGPHHFRPTMTTTTEKRTPRRWRRFHLDVPIRVIVHTHRKTSVFVGRGNELSEGGMAVTAGVELRLGDESEIEFTPPYSNSPIRIRGVVRNRAGYRYGMEFVAGDDQELQAVQRLKSVLGVLGTG